MAQQIEKVTNNQTALALNECNSKAVAEFRAKLDSVKCVADIVGMLNEDAENTRLSWVKNALVCYKGFASVTKKERGKVLAELKSKLIYEKAYIYRMRDAGEKLIAYLDGGKKAENLPYSMNEFLAQFRAEPAKVNEIHNLSRIGGFKIDTIEYHIYKGEKTMTDGKKKECTLYSSAEGLKDLTSTVTGDENGKETTHYYNGKVEVSVYFLNI